MHNGKCLRKVVLQVYKVNRIGWFKGLMNDQCHVPTWNQNGGNGLNLCL